VSFGLQGRWLFCIIKSSLTIRSVEFAQALLQQHHSQLEHALLDINILTDAHILELGFAILSPRSYTAMLILLFW
jgi:hypothetical protein